MRLLAFDVAKRELVVFDGTLIRKIENSAQSIRRFLKDYPGFVVAAEPTSHYHFELVFAAHELGCTVHLVNPKELRNYKNSRSFRAKTDPLDARFLHEFVTRHEGELRAWTPAAPHIRELRDLLGKRQLAVKALMQLTQACSQVPAFSEAKAALKKLIDTLTESMIDLANKDENFQRMQTIPGVGPISSLVLTYLFGAYRFESVDSLVAFLGLDLMVNDSGTHQGRRSLSKRGDPLLRHLLTCAGWSLLRTKLAKDKSAKLKEQNRAHAERMVIATRKILKVAYALNSKKNDFEIEKWRWAA
jgi:transposase